MAIDTSFSTRAIEAYNIQLSKSLERLSTGRRINRASDNPAGFAIIEKLGVQLKGIEQAERNVRQGMGMLQVAEGDISTIGEALGRNRILRSIFYFDTFKVEHGKGQDNQPDGLNS